MRKLLFAAAMTAMLCACSEKVTRQANMEIVPKPNDVEIFQQGQNDFGNFVIDTKTIIVSDDVENQFNAEYLQSYLKNAVEGDFLIENSAKKNYISLEINDEITDNEAYTLVVDGKCITIQGGTTAGVFYGIQTLMQMLPADAYNKGAEAKAKAVEVPAMRIADAPRFHYRGLHFDVSRTFFGTEFMYKLLDAMSYYKINNLHWHLADDQGWRVEIKAYPRLTELGAWRGPDELLKPAYGSGMERNGGFYTQEEIKAIVKYAADRNINIIPEIDLPGHSKAVAVTYPEILCDINTKHYSCQWESNNVWCIGREENYVMLDNIIKEMVELFPSRIFHIGGDEVNMDSWKECPRCQALMKEKSMTEVVELQNYFVRRLEAILAKYGRTMAGWDEIIDGGELLPESVVYAWASLDRGMKSVREGHPTVMLIGEYMYFDMKQSADERGLKWAGITPIEKTYSFDPVGTFELNEDEKKLVLGPQGGAWAECFQVKDYAEYQVFPKLLALSEIGWTNRELRRWDDFQNRLFDAQYDRMYAMDLKFRIAPAEVRYEDGRLIATKDNELLAIRYTDDKTAPTLESPVYDGPIATETPENYRFATFFNDRSSIARGAQNIELHHYLKPATKVESNIPFMEDINRLVDYDLETYCFTSRDVVAGDYVKFTFDEPVECRSIGMCTGYYTLAVYGILNGYIEYSYDGENYIKGGRFTYDMFDGYRAYCYPEHPVKSVRVVADGICEHEVTGIQDLRIE
ncbi:MAG: family 20 glycosylhydrolase [Bacteroidales bacterium]|nr:family 20 glycosylhydrolase [Bacteroidales bacterium]